MSGLKRADKAESEKEVIKKKAKAGENLTPAQLMAQHLAKDKKITFEAEVIFDPDEAALKTASIWIDMPSPWQELTGVRGIPFGHVIAIQGKPDCGKCLGKNTPVLMFDGSIKLVQDIQVGDKLMGPDSKARDVLSITRGRETMYKVIPNYGEPWECNESHILSLKCNFSRNQDWEKGKIYNISIRDYLNLQSNISHSLKLWRTGVEFDKKVLQYDPYWVGLWLGDGTRATTTITKDEPEIEPYLEEFADRNNLLYRKAKYGDSCSDYRFTTPLGQKNPLYSFIKTLSVSNEKRIPKEYLTSDRQDRLSLLAGLLDTDGYQGGAGFEIATKYLGLKDDILFLARSLGFRATFSEKIIDGRIYYRIYISGDCDTIPTLISRKQAPKRMDKRDHLVTGFTLETLGEDDYYGFTISDDHLFLLGDFTVTHNTTTAMHGMIEAQRQGYNVVLIDTEHKFNFKRFKLMGGDTSNLLHIPCDSIEQGFDAIDRVSAEYAKLYPDIPVLFTWDSLGMTPTEEELKGNAYSITVGSASRVIKRNIRRQLASIFKRNVSLIFVNHVYDNINALFGNSTKGYGGNGAYYAAVLVLEVAKIGEWYKQQSGKKLVLGIKAKIKCTKNHMSNFQGKVVEVNIGDNGITVGKVGVSETIDDESHNFADDTKIDGNINFDPDSDPDAELTEIPDCKPKQ